MGRNRTLFTPLVVAVFVTSIVLAPACRRQPDEPVTDTSIDDVEMAELELDPIELPLQNPDIGITLNAVPSGMVATLNTQVWIEITDTRSPKNLYVFVASPPDSPGISPQTVEEFEAWVDASQNGRNTGGGSIDTAHGPAIWASGTYMDDDGMMDHIQVFVPHPSGSGSLILYSVCPTGRKAVEDQLAVMQELVAEIS